jgi:hypothetical protein
MPTTTPLTLGVIKCSAYNIDVAASGTPVETTFNPQTIDLGTLKAESTFGFATSSSFTFQPGVGFAARALVLEPVASIRTAIGASTVV